MERDHKLSPKWRGPFPIIRIENPFQVHYEGRGKEKIAHVRHCKRFNSVVANGKKAYVIADNDVISNDSMDHPGEGASDLLTPRGGGGGHFREAWRRLCKNKERGEGHLGAILCLTIPGRCPLNISKFASRALLELLWRSLHLLLG